MKLLLGFVILAQAIGNLTVNSVSVATRPGTCDERDMRDAINGIAPFLVPVESVLTVYRSPAAELRRQADAMEAREKAVEKVLAVHACLQQNP